MKKTRVLIVEDSRTIREFLTYIIARDPRLEVAGAAASAEEALRILDRVSPDVISMDVRLPGMNGLEATHRIMCDRPTPIVVVSASVEREDLNITMNALRAGALSVVEKPSGTTSEEYEALAGRLCTQLSIMSEVRVVRRRGNPGIPAPVKRRLFSRAGFKALGVVSSTGGPAALCRLLCGLGADFPLPVLLVQHITGCFLEGFASWLDSLCPFSVQILHDRTVPARGTVYIAAQDLHLRIDGGYFQVDGGDPVCGQRPSGSALFDSMAKALGAEAMGVLLTGMGEDGAQGLLEVRRSGGHTIAEDESTAVVYGMPAAAVRIGAVCESLPLTAIAPRILDLTAPRREVA